MIEAVHLMEGSKCQDLAQDLSHTSFYVCHDALDIFSSSTLMNTQNCEHNFTIVESPSSISFFLKKRFVSLIYLGVQLATVTLDG